jgi:hypothetical protein
MSEAEVSQKRVPPTPIPKRLRSRKPKAEKSTAEESTEREGKKLAKQLQAKILMGHSKPTAKRRVKRTPQVSRATVSAEEASTVAPTTAVTMDLTESEQVVSEIAFEEERQEIQIVSGSTEEGSQKRRVSNKRKRENSNQAVKEDEGSPKKKARHSQSNEAEATVSSGSELKEPRMKKTRKEPKAQNERREQREKDGQKKYDKKEEQQEQKVPKSREGQKEKGKKRRSSISKAVGTSSKSLGEAESTQLIRVAEGEKSISSNSLGGDARDKRKTGPPRVEGEQAEELRRSLQISVEERRKQEELRLLQARERAQEIRRLQREQRDKEREEKRREDETRKQLEVRFCSFFSLALPFFSPSHPLSGS